MNFFGVLNLALILYPHMHIYYIINIILLNACFGVILYYKFIRRDYVQTDATRHDTMRQGYSNNLDPGVANELLKFDFYKFIVLRRDISRRCARFYLLFFKKAHVFINISVT